LLLAVVDVVVVAVVVRLWENAGKAFRVKSLSHFTHSPFSFCLRAVTQVVTLGYR